MAKTLLIPTDLSENSKNSIQYAAQLAKHLQADMYLLHVLSTHQGGGLQYWGTSKELLYTPSSNLSELKASAETQLQSICTAIKANITDKINIHYEVSTGFVTEEIKKIEENHTISMILIAGHENNDFLADFLGHQNKLIKETISPIMVIPPNFHYKPFKKIIYATNYSKQDKDALKSLSELSKAYNAHITATHVTKQVEEGDEKAASTFERTIKEETGNMQLSVALIPGDGVANTLEYFANELKADLIATLKSHKSFLQKIVTHAVTKELTQSLQIPLLIYREVH